MVPSKWGQRIIVSLWLLYMYVHKTWKTVVKPVLNTLALASGFYALSLFLSQKAHHHLNIVTSYSNKIIKSNNLIGRWKKFQLQLKGKIPQLSTTLNTSTEGHSLPSVHSDKIDLIFVVLTPLSAIFQLYHGDQF